MRQLKKLKSANTWQSYKQKFGGTFFTAHGVQCGEVIGDGL